MTNNRYNLWVTKEAKGNVFVNCDTGRTKIDGRRNSFINSRVGLMLKAVKATPWWYSFGMAIFGAVAGVVLDRLATILFGW